MREPDVELMQRVIDGQVSLQQIKRLHPSSRLMTALVAYMLLHHDEYIISDIYLRRPYYRVIMTLLDCDKGRAERLVEISRQNCLHKTLAEGPRVPHFGREYLALMVPPALRLPR